MALLIDGYNLLHVTDIFGSPVGSETALHASRQALLAFLAVAIDKKTRAETTIVFDAAGAPPSLPRVVSHEGLTVRFARLHDSADALIEELIEECASPRTLTVVSSDHRVQRAARRRGSSYVDSDRWYAEMKASLARTNQKTTSSAKPSDRVPPEQVEHWLRIFTAEDETTSANPGESDNPRTTTPLAEEPIFPPGYAEDLLDDE